MTKDIRYNFARASIILLVLQPIIDILTNLNNVNNNFVSVGIVARMIILFLGSIFLVGELINKKNWIVKIYLLTLGIYLLINFFVSYMNKPVFNYKLEITMIIKAVYPIIMFLVYLLSIDVLLNKNTDKNYFLKPLIFNTVFINLVFLIAKITGTELRSYGANYKIGHSAWFFSGNEIGNILAMLFPIIIIFLFSNQNTVCYANKVRIIFYMTIFSMLSIGTKVGSFSIIITLIITNISIFIIMKFKNEHIINYDLFKNNRMLLLITLLVMIGAYSYLPSTLNTRGQYNTLYERSLKRQKDNEDIHKNEKNDVEFSDVIDSGRSNINKNTKKEFKKAPTIQKILGMGYAGNYKGRPRLVEKDFHDSLYQFGLLGFVILYSPFIYIGMKLICFIYKDYLIFIDIKYIMLITSILLATGISFSSGHVFYSPAVSIYLSYLLSYLYSIGQRDYIKNMENEVIL